MAERRRRSGFVGKVDAEGHRSVRLLGSPREVPAKVPRGLRGPAVHRRQAIVAAAVLTCVTFR
jgi:hypothetical protein